VLDAIAASTSPDAIAAVITSKGSWAGAAGVAGPDDRPAEPTDQFSIGTISQIVLSATVLRLAEQHTFDLDAPLDEYIAGFDEVANGATVRDALAFRSGIGDTLPGSLDRAAAECGHAWSRDDILATFPEPEAAAGTEYAYSNPTYKLIGWAIEDSTGRPLTDAIAESVMDATERDRMLLQGPGSSPREPWALPLEGRTGPIDLDAIGLGGALPCLAVATFAHGGGGMASDAPTLARWAWRLFAGEVITVESLRLMAEQTDNHGLGINRLTEFAPDLALGRLGNLPGYGAVLGVLPERGIVAVLFINNAEAVEASQLVKLVRALDE
jgi:CubicO group peptidase (beta-lactamase class C family)